MIKLRQGILLKTRRHHNNKGYHQIKRGKTRLQVAYIAKRLKLPYNIYPKLKQECK